MPVVRSRASAYGSSRWVTGLQTCHHVAVGHRRQRARHADGAGLDQIASHWVASATTHDPWRTSQVAGDGVSTTYNVATW
jgi:hypothetical protein